MVPSPSLPILLHHQNSSFSFSYPPVTNDDPLINFDFEDMLDNYQSLNQPSYQDSTPLNLSSSYEQNPVFREMDFADEQNMHFQEAITAGSCSQISDNISTFMPEPSSFNIDDAMIRERATLALRMKTNLEVVDDGYKWRKYGKKKVKTSPYPRNYFKCSAIGCNVKKRIERDGDDSSYVITTYHGVHHHPR